MCFKFLALVSGLPDIGNDRFNTTDIKCEIDKPYLFYIDIAKCKSANQLGCNSSQVLNALYLLLRYHSLTFDLLLLGLFRELSKCRIYL